MSLASWRNRASNLVIKNTDEHTVCLKLALVLYFFMFFYFFFANYVKIFISTVLLLDPYYIQCKTVQN